MVDFLQWYQTPGSLHRDVGLEVKIYWNYSLSRDMRNKNIIMSSFKCSWDIQKKEGGPDNCFR